MQCWTRRESAVTKILLDTNVLVAAYVKEHEHHSTSLALWERIGLETTYISTHVLAEFFASVTRLPHGMGILPDHALLCLQEALAQLRIISLEEKDYRRALARTVASGGTGGRIYDALHLEAALKAGVSTIYTWNLKHFLPLAADTNLRVLSPAQTT